MPLPDMELAALLISVIALVAGGAAYLFVRAYLPSYFSEKGKNLATKEDIASITHDIERVKTQYLGEIERLKSSLAAENLALEKRRKVYEEIAASLRVFVAGHNAGDDTKNHFLAVYASAWLWAPDELVRALNAFLEVQVSHAATPGTVPQDSMKRAYAEVMLAMRRDAGFADSNVQAAEYKFVQF